MELNGRSGLIKPPGMQLRDAELKIGELERKLEWALNRVAYLMVAVQALGTHANLTPDQARTMTDEFIAKREMEEHEKMKEQFKAGVANGTAPGFTIVNRDEAPPGPASQ